MKSRRRRYRMAARAEKAQDTAARLVAATQQLFAERPYDAITLAAVATRAGVTLQTALRRFGSKAGLIAAAAKDGAARVDAQRGATKPGDVRGAVKNLFDHYEEWADVALRLLAEEARVPELAALAAHGRKTHADWVARVFAPQLARSTGQARRIRRAQLIAACDVYVWKLLRRDQGLARPAAEAAMLGLIEGP